MQKEKAEIIGSIINEMMVVAEKRETREPEWWLDKAQILATLWTVVTEDLVNAEMAYKKEIWDEIEAGANVAKATMKIEGTSDNYKKYRYLKKKDEQVNEIIKVAKKRIDAERV